MNFWKIIFCIKFWINLIALKVIFSKFELNFTPIWAENVENDEGRDFTFDFTGWKWVVHAKEKKFHPKMLIYFIPLLFSLTVSPIKNNGKIHPRRGWIFPPKVPWVNSPTLVGEKITLPSTRQKFQVDTPLSGFMGTQIFKICGRKYPFKRLNGTDYFLGLFWKTESGYFKTTNMNRKSSRNTNQAASLVFVFRELFRIRIRWNNYSHCAKFQMKMLQPSTR